MQHPDGTVFTAEMDTQRGVAYSRSERALDLLNWATENPLVPRIVTVIVLEQGQKFLSDYNECGPSTIVYSEPGDLRYSPIHYDQSPRAGIRATRPTDKSASTIVFPTMSVGETEIISRDVISGNQTLVPISQLPDPLIKGIYGLQANVDCITAWRTMSPHVHKREATLEDYYMKVHDAGITPHRSPEWLDARQFEGADRVQDVSRLPALLRAQPLAEFTLKAQAVANEWPVMQPVKRSFSSLTRSLL